MKVLLIQPESSETLNIYHDYPLGIGYIASELTANNHQTKLIDLQVEPLDVLYDILNNFQPEVVGISILTNTVNNAIKVLNIVKQDTNVITICGGIHADIFHKDMTDAGFDFVLRGEAEDSMLELLQSFEILKKNSPTSDSIHLGNFCSFISNKPTYQVNVDKLNLLNRSAFNLSLYSQHSVLTSRGCQFSCKYCGYSFHKPLRIRSVRSILDELSIIAELNMQKEIFFADDILLGSDWEKIKELCTGLIQRKLNINWIAQLRPDHVDEDGLQQMKRAGCRAIYFGIESGAKASLSCVARRMNITKAIKGILLTKKLGIFVKTGFIIGLPGDYFQQLKALDFINATHPNSISFHMLVPYPGTELFDNRAQFGINIYNIKDWDSYSLYRSSPNITFDYLPPEKIKLLIITIQKHLNGLGYSNGHSSSKVNYDVNEFYYSLPIYESSVIDNDRNIP